MMVLMLPLGALNAWVPAVRDGAPQSLQTAAQSSPQSPRTCRAAFLPGVGCAKFLSLTDLPKAEQPPGTVLHALRARLWQMQDQPDPPKEPPRTV